MAIHKVSPSQEVKMVTTLKLECNSNQEFLLEKNIMQYPKLQRELDKLLDVL